ncbi:VOC family protein [Aestuariivirga sp.]|uniref:VOC family protein n=1 Tax=Aestuariivirga sp. TaxID=2650926 RepID=UPI0039E6F44C
MSASPSPRINFITLGVRDLAVSKDFYQRLGLVPHGMSNDNVAFFDVNGTVLSLFGHDALVADATLAADPPPRFRGVSLAWNGTSDAEVDAIIAHARACGATIVKEPHKVFWGGYSGYFSDPDGHLWEVAHNPFITFDSDGHVILPAS